MSCMVARLNWYVNKLRVIILYDNLTFLFLLNLSFPPFLFYLVNFIHAILEIPGVPAFFESACSHLKSCSQLEAGRHF